MEWVDFYDAAITGSWNARYLINHSTQCAYIAKDNKKRVGWIKNKDIDWNGITELPKEVQRRVCGRVCDYDFGIFDFENGTAKIMWQISPNGKYHYLDKYYGGKTTNEKDIRLYGVIDTNCKIVEKLHIIIYEE